VRRTGISVAPSSGVVSRAKRFQRLSPQPQGGPSLRYSRAEAEGAKTSLKSQLQAVTSTTRLGGGGGIRTPGGVSPTAVFKTAAIDHSATPPHVRIVASQRFTVAIILRRIGSDTRFSFAAGTFSGTRNSDVPRALSSRTPASAYLRVNQLSSGKRPSGESADGDASHRRSQYSAAHWSFNSVSPLAIRTTSPSVAPC
jgi:hypothetical protein